ncbi:hypothetical protein LXL04_028634 [Taraxacum kok-saghyz]
MVINQAGALAFYILSALFFDSFVIIFVVTVLLSALDFWVVKNVSGRILVGLRWWNEIDDNGESVWKFECLDQESLARMNKKDSWLFWWTLYLTAVVWIFFGIFSLIRFQADLAAQNREKVLNRESPELALNPRNGSVTRRQIVSMRLSREEPQLRKEIAEYMLDVGSHMWSKRRSKANKSWGF